MTIFWKDFEILRLLAYYDRSLIREFFVLHQTPVGSAGRSEGPRCSMTA